MFVTYYAASIWHTPTIGPSENTDVWLPDYSTVVISTRGGAAVYNSLFRTLWSLGVGLMIFLCDQGYGFLINDFLSASIFKILSRTTYLVYLMHIPLYFVWNNYVEQPTNYTLTTFALLFTALVTFVFIISAIMFLFIELPFAKLWGNVVKIISQEKQVKNKSEVKPKDNSEKIEMEEKADL